ncbi:DUF1484 family protein [Chromobacterium sp. Panama]|uniref:DUF1484 family protein n=1 Tax=Chromobacterium sp. Panama TaxID=2161826 RepID=UPI001304FFA7|nr:DUF1484 family protein [Chromobacterium sp. Panama]
MNTHIPSCSALEQLRRLNQHMQEATQHQSHLSPISQQLAQQCAEIDEVLLQALVDIHAANVSLQAMLTLLQRRDEPLLFSSEEAASLLELVQQRLQRGLSQIDCLL